MSGADATGKGLAWRHLRLQCRTCRRRSPGGSETTTDRSGRLAIEGVVLARYAQELADAADHGDDLPIVAQSVRNRFTGLVTRVVRDTVMAQVDIQAGPHRFVSIAQS